MVAKNAASKSTRELSREIMIFVRAEGFYPIQAVQGIPIAQQAGDHAALNPGTLRVEDARGKVLWSLQ